MTSILGLSPRRVIRLVKCFIKRLKIIILGKCDGQEPGVFGQRALRAHSALEERPLQEFLRLRCRHDMQSACCSGTSAGGCHLVRT